VSARNFGRGGQERSNTQHGQLRMASGEVSLEDSWSRGMWDVVCWFCIVLDDLGIIQLAQNGPFQGHFGGNRAVVSKTRVFWLGLKAWFGHCRTSP